MIGKVQSVIQDFVCGEWRDEKGKGRKDVEIERT